MDRETLRALYREHITRLEATYGAAITAAGLDVLVLHSGVATPHSSFDDQYWPLRPTPAFGHWIALPQADCAVVLRPGARPRLIRTVTADFWEGQPSLDLDHAWDSFEVVTVASASAIAGELPGGRTGFIGDAAAVAASFGVAAEDINPPGLIAELDGIRRIKSAYEVECIREANQRASRGHLALRRAFAEEPRSELELHLLYLSVTAQDSIDTPYQNIVAIDDHAAVLHHVRYSRAQPGDGAHTLLVDAGATCHGYASDITRTMVRGQGDGAALFAALIDGMETLQRAVCDRVGPGLAYESLHDQSHELLAPLLVELGIARGSAEALVERGVTRALFPHGLGHSLGLQVHDVGCRTDAPSPRNAYLRTTTTTAEGMVFTIEPGCYFIDALLAPLRETADGALLDWDVVDRLRPFGGIRIEDNLLVTASGNRNLTRDNGLWTA